MIRQQLPSYPLFVKDPYFSVWCPREELNGGDTVFWNGESRPMYGLVHANGETYCFMGNLPQAKKIDQTELCLAAFSTDYRFRCDAFDLSVRFLSPLPPDDLVTLSMPVCYLSYELRPKRPLTGVSVSLWLDERHCYDRTPSHVRGGVLRFPGYEAAWFGRRRQLPLSHAGDSFAADWGYTYLTGESCFFLSRSALNGYLKTGRLCYDLDKEERKYLAAENRHGDVDLPARGKFLVAFDDVCSVFYFGEFLKGYYFADGKTVFHAIAEGYDRYADIASYADRFDADLRRRAAKHGDRYYPLLVASLRQSVAAHKLVKDKAGNTLFLSKECHSNGCIATVDVSYPSSPLYLLYNPELVCGMLRPIFRFARMPVWPYPFAPHDAGTYPYCLGQTYGIQEKDDKYHAKSVFMETAKNLETYPMLYTFPADADLYDTRYQMPVEECGDMLILTAAAVLCGSGADLAAENLDLLAEWAAYLEKNGPIPVDQPCSDDFAEHLEKNANLAVKAAVGLAAYSLLLRKLGKKKAADEALARARAFAGEWRSLCGTSGHSPLVLGGDKDTYSLKYNLAFDKLFGTGLFPQDLLEAETDYYVSKAGRYGTPLDSRAAYSKTDWLLWAASLTDRPEKQNAFLEALFRYLCETPGRVPFADWYDTVTAEPKEFSNRPVQGGLFLLLLADSGKLKAD